MATYEEFESAVSDGADCRRLFALHDQLPVEHKEHAKARLQRIGCYSPTSTRSDASGGPDQYSPTDYQRAFEVVARDRDRIWAEAGTDDAQRAASRYAERVTDIDRNAAYVAALDALQDRAPRH